MARWGARKASEWLGARVELSKLSVTFPLRVSIDDFYVEDFQGDTMIFVSHVVAPVKAVVPRPLLLHFGRVELRDGGFTLRENELDSINIKEVVDKIKSARGDGERPPFRLEIDAISASNLYYNQYLNLGEYDSPIDYGNMVLALDTIALEEFKVIDDSVRMDLRLASFTEQSGFRVDTLSSRSLIVHNGKVLLDDVAIINSDTRMSLPMVHLIGRDWDIYEHYIDSVRTRVVSRGSTLSTRSLAYFADVFEGMDLTARRLDCSTDNVLSRFVGKVSSADVEGVGLVADFTSKGLPDFQTTVWNLNVRSVDADAAAVQALVRGVTGGELPASVEKMLATQGRMRVHGALKGSMENFESGLTLSSMSGVAHLRAAMRKRPSEGYDVKYGVSTADFSLGRLLSTASLGNVTVDASLSGALLTDGFDAEYQIEVDSVRMLEYTYGGIDASGTIDRRRIELSLNSVDPNLQLAFDGTADFNDAKPKYVGVLNLERGDLAAIGINRRDSVSVVSFDAMADIEATGLDDLAGEAYVDNGMYRFNGDTLRSERISLMGHNNAQSKYLKFDSEFADAEFRSRLSYDEILAYLGRFVDNYLPLLENQTPLRREVKTPSQSEVGDYSLLSVKCKDVRDITPAIADGLQVADGTSVRFMFNPVSEEFSLTASSDYLEYNEMFASGLNINADNKHDSLALRLAAGNVYVKRLYIPNLRVQGGARNHNLSLSTRFANTEENYSAMLGLRTFMTHTRNGRAVEVFVTPSHITSGDKTWFINSAGIVYDTARIAVRNFVVSSPSKGGLGGVDTDSLRIYGVASRSDRDTLHLRMKNMDLTPLLKIAQSVGYDISAVANGRVDMVSALRGGRLDAQVDIDSMSVSGVDVAPVRISSMWDVQRQRVLVNMDNRRTGGNVITGFYSPAQKRMLADVTADSLHLSLLDPLLEDVLQNTTGKANARLRVTGDFSGERPQVKINGLASAARFETTVSYLNVRYGMDKALIDFKDNVISLRPNFATDSRGQRCNVGLNVDLNRLKNIKYRIDLRPENLMVLNTTVKDNELFYGTLYASGSAVIKGDNMGAVMTARARPTGDSRFYFPLNSTTQASSASFVRFVDADKRQADSTDYLQSKLLAYERKRKRIDEESTPFRLGLDIDLTPDAELVLIIDPTMGGDMQGRGEGNLSINVDTATDAFTMHGAVNIVEGVYNFAMHNLFADKKFQIVPGGTITWTGDPTGALLSLEAVYKLKASLAPLAAGNSEMLRGNVPVECKIRLTDELMHPTIAFDVDVPNADLEIQNVVANAMTTQEMTATQFFSLLAFGSFYSESGGANESLSVGSVGSATGFEFLSNQISSWLSSDQYDIILRYIPSNELTGDEFDFGFSKGLIGNRLLLEIEGNYVSDRATTGAANNASNLSGDFFLTWLLNRTGSLKLKGFSQTITRFDENQGLQESGVGLYFKKDFNSLRELFTRKNKRNRKFATDSDQEKAYFDNPDFRDTVDEIPETE
ncbi:MAG: translocation/assembly module TamB domain-containing protein [Rikenellaceae bacterium]|nr:translocation/assembly module TamB domain-containing protein [Rikenellaceae bacterium]